MLRAGLLIAVISLSAGCAAEPRQTDAQWKEHALAFIQDGVTTREQVLLQLGGPTAQFEADRILTYRIMRNSTEGITVVQRAQMEESAGMDWSGAQYCLVLVFQGPILQKHSLVSVR